MKNKHLNSYKTPSTNKINSLLKYYLQNPHKGFTLMELLVVVIIIGVLAAVALPALEHSPKGCVGKARESEIKNGVGTIIRSQQAYHFENSKFSSSFDELGVKKQGKYSVFSVEVTSTIAYALSTAENFEENGNGMRSYSGAIFFNKEEQSFQKIMCQTDTIAETAPKPILVDGILTCPENTMQIH